MQPGMIDDFMLCLVSDDNLYQGKILVNVHKDEKSITKDFFLESCFSLCYEIWLTEAESPGNFSYLIPHCSFYYVRGRPAAIT